MSDTPDSTAEQKEQITLRETFRLLFKASKGFWLVNMVNFGDGIAYFGILTLLVLYLGQNVGFSDAWSGRAVSLFTGGVTLFMIGGGLVTDKLGVRKALLIALLILGYGRVLLIISPELFSGPAMTGGVWLALALMALGSGIMQPALYAGAKEYTDPRTATVTYSLIYAIMNLGIVAENFVSPFIRTDEVFLHLGGWKLNGLGFGISGTLRFCLYITALVIVLHLLLFRRKVEEQDRIGVFADQRKAAGPQLTFWQKIRELPLFNPRFAFFIFMLLPVQTLFAHQWLTIPDYIMRAYPANVGAKYEWISGINPFIIVIFVPLIGALTRRAKVLTMMIIGTVISAGITFILVPGPGLARLITYCIIFSLGEAAWSARFYEYVARIAPPGKVGSYMGMAGIPWFLAKATTGLYSGLFLQKFVPQGGPQDTSTLWLIYAFIACLSPVGLILAKKWLDKGMLEEKTA